MWTRFLDAIGLNSYETDLAKVKGLTRVRVRGHIASEDLVVSPMSELRASLVRTVVGQKLIFGIEDAYPYQQLGEDYAFERLLIESGPFTICVDKDVQIEVQFDRRASGASSKLSDVNRLPDALRPLVKLQTRGSLVYGEQTLCKGDPVELLAWVEPARIADLPVAAESYRASGHPNGFRAVVHEGEGVKLRDRSLDEA